MFSPPFVVELLLWPLQTIEYGLLYAVASTSAPAAAEVRALPKVSISADCI